MDGRPDSVVHVEVPAGARLPQDEAASSLAETYFNEFEPIEWELNARTPSAVMRLGVEASSNDTDAIAAQPWSNAACNDWPLAMAP